MTEPFGVLLSFLEQNNFPRSAKVLKEEMGLVSLKFFT